MLVVVTRPEWNDFLKSYMEILRGTFEMMKLDGSLTKDDIRQIVEKTKQRYANIKLTPNKNDGQVGETECAAAVFALEMVIGELTQRCFPCEIEN